jgi:hypothetical protein
MAQGYYWSGSDATNEKGQLKPVVHIFGFFYEQAFQFM